MLRDIRLKKFNDSIIAILESNLHDGPTFFNCYPNFSMNLRNDKTSNSIKLYVQTLEHIVEYSYPGTKNNKVINLLEQSDSGNTSFKNFY